MTKPNVSGPIIVWENHGYNSWMPKSYPDLRSALCDERRTSDWVITEVTSLRDRESGRGRWKPIKNAPRDGRLIAVKGDDWSNIAAWDGTQWCFRLPRLGSMVDAPLAPYIGKYARPTHWHPYFIDSVHI